MSRIRAAPHWRHRWTSATAIGGRCVRGDIRSTAGNSIEKPSWQFLREYGVDYIIVGADEQTTLGTHLRGDPDHFTSFSEFDGWSIYQVR